MLLEVHERMVLVGLLPKEGDYAALKSIRRAREMLSFTPEEISFLEMKTVPGVDGKPVTQWSNEKAASNVKDCPIEEYIFGVLRDALADMNKKKKLSDQYVSVYEKLVVTYK